MLPTVCATHWMVSVCEDLCPGYHFFAYDNYRLYKGVVFDGKQTESLAMDVEQIASSDTDLTLQVKVWSTNQKGFRVNHYIADVVLVKQIAAAPQLNGLDSDLLTNGEPSLETTAPYENGTLFHGASFQSIQQVLDVDEKGMMLRCNAPMVAKADQGQFGVSSTNPFVDDVLYQAMLVWVKINSNKGSLPSSAKRYEQYELIPQGAEFYVSLNVVSDQPNAMSADITLHSKSGKIYGRMFGAEVTISDALNPLFLQNSVVKKSQDRSVSAE